MDMDISMDIHAKSVDMDMDMDGKFHIHGNPVYTGEMLGEPALSIILVGLGLFRNFRSPCSPLSVNSQPLSLSARSP